jgi:hypothetical protein
LATEFAFDEKIEGMQVAVRLSTNNDIPAMAASLPISKPGSPTDLQIRSDLCQLDAPLGPTSRAACLAGFLRLLLDFLIACACIRARAVVSVPLATPGEWLKRPPIWPTTFFRDCRSVSGCCRFPGSASAN